MMTYWQGSARLLFGTPVCSLELWTACVGWRSIEGALRFLELVLLRRASSLLGPSRLASVPPEVWQNVRRELLAMGGERQRAHELELVGMSTCDDCKGARGSPTLRWLEAHSRSPAKPFCPACQEMGRAVMVCLHQSEVSR